MKRSNKVLVGIPAHNEVSTIARIISDIRNLHKDLSILLVNDGSTDGTPELARQLGVEVVSHTHNQGYGMTLRTIFSQALTHDYEALLTIDGDGQHDPADIDHFLDSFNHISADIYSGSRYLPESTVRNPSPPLNAQANIFFCQFLKRAYGLRLTDSLCGYKLYRRDILSQLSFELEGYLAPIEILISAAQNQLQIVEVPVTMIYSTDPKPPVHYLESVRTELNHFYPLMSDKEKAIAEEYLKVVRNLQ